MSVDSFLNEVFDKSKGRENLTFESLCRLVEEAMLEAELNMSASDLVDELVANFSSEIPKMKPKADSKNTITDLGSRVARNDFAKKAKQYIMKKHKLTDAQVELISDEKRGVVTTIKVGKLKVFLKAGSTGTSATAFEGNLVIAINNAIGSPSAKDIEAELRCGSKDKKTGDCKGGWVEESPASDKQAAQIAANLVPMINKALPEQINSINKNSGGAGGGLSEAYIAMGVRSGEPKADLSINDDPRFGTSVKKAGGSQYASAQAPEAKAMFEVAYREVNPEGDLEQQIAELQEYIANTAGRPGVGKFYQLKDKVVTMLVAQGAEKKKVETAYQKVAAKLSGMSMEKGSAARLEVPEEQKAAFEATLRAMTDEGIQPLRESVQQILVSDRFRLAVFKEAATGRGKFANPGDAANYMLAWDPASPEKSVFEELSDDWFKKKYKSGAVNFRMRNRGEAAKRGGAYNIDAIEPKEKTMTADDDLQEWWRDDKYYLDDAFSHHEDSVVLSEALEQQLVEGILDSVRNALAKIYGSTKDAIKWGMEQVKAFASAARNYVNKFVGFIKEALSRGFGALADFLGFEIEGLEYEI